MKKIVVLSGAGISAESGISTFRDMGGLWEQYDVMEVASIDGWHKNKELILNFYNERRAQLATVEPNRGHIILKELEQYFDVSIITQNVDNLHERAGSENVLHLHGELTKVRSSYDEVDVIDIGYKPINIGDMAKDGSQLRPHIVWFGEAVPLMERAVEITVDADIFIIVGTSLNVYPAAGLVKYLKKNVPVYLIDPNDIIHSISNINIIKEPASTGLKKLKDILLC